MAEKLEIKLKNGKILTAELYDDGIKEHPEITVYVKDAKTDLIEQDIAVIRPHETKNCVHDGEKVDVLVWADENDESYTNKFLINPVPDDEEDNDFTPNASENQETNPEPEKSAYPITFDPADHRFLQAEASDQVVIYTDGACSGNPGPGGWAAVILKNGIEEMSISGAQPSTTNNRMELEAVIFGLTFVSPACRSITVFSDSQYVVRGMNEWITNWKKNNWKDVKNADLWKDLDRVCTDRHVSFVWTKGHAGSPYNEKANTLATNKTHNSIFGGTTNGL